MNRMAQGVSQLGSLLSGLGNLITGVLTFLQDCCATKTIRLRLSAYDGGVLKHQGSCVLAKLCACFSRHVW